MEELSREERREHVKKQQELERRAHERKAAFRKFGFWILILGLVFGLGYWGYKGLTKPLPGQKFDDLGREHVNDISNITYNSNPPTSGTHFPVWAKKGVYDRMISDGYLVHSLEHGYIVINYNCEDPSLKSQISTKGGSASGGQISTPQDFAAAFHKMLNDKWPMINGGKGNESWKVKALIAFWLLAGVIPSAITRDGGNHATRLILILPPLVFLMGYGLVTFTQSLSKKVKFIFVAAYLGFWILCFGFYEHAYWIHNPWDSERWWHAGWQESIQTIKQIDNDYDKVIITMSDEPAWIFFAAHYEYDPVKWHQGYPMQTATLNGFGKMSHIDKFYFGSFHPPTGGIYDLPKYIDNRTLYLASAKEIGANLIQEPERTPAGLNLIKAVAYPSGEPAFYLFTHN